MTATIGILNEKSLHASLKQWYAKPGDMLEAPLDGYVVDILRGNHVIEIQTGNFASISRKLRALTQHYRVTLVYPIVIERWILQLPSTVHGRPMRRRSPKRFRRDGLFPELVSFPDLLQCMNFSLVVAFIQEEEVRRLKGNPSGLRRASVTIERRLVGVVGRHRFETPLRSVVPHPLGTSRTVSDFALGPRLEPAAMVCSKGRLLSPKVRSQHSHQKRMQFHCLLPHFESRIDTHDWFRQVDVQYSPCGEQRCNKKLDE
jgi:hypothetical protein